MIPPKYRVDDALRQPICQEIPLAETQPCHRYVAAPAATRAAAVLTLGVMKNNRARFVYERPGLHVTGESDSKRPDDIDLLRRPSLSP